MTGLAGGDHLHFCLLLHGVQVNPLEWWDPQWVQPTSVTSSKKTKPLSRPHPLPDQMGPASFPMPHSQNCRRRF